MPSLSSLSTVPSIGSRLTTASQQHQLPNATNTAFGRLQVMTEKESEKEEKEEIEYRESDIVPARQISETLGHMEMDIENINLMEEQSEEVTPQDQPESVQHVRLAR